MKNLFFTLVLFFALTGVAVAQEEPVVPDSLNGWGHNWTVGLNGAQAAYSNWSQGGVNNLAVAGNSRLTSLYQKERFSYIFQFNVRYGQNRIADEGVRKTDDRLSIRNRFLYDLQEDSDFKIFGNLHFRTQFGKGYDYGAGPNEEDVLISNFMAPGYFTQNAGLAYIPSENFSFEAGLGLQQTFVRDENLSETYGLNPGDTFRNEAGATLAAVFSKTIASNINWNSSIESFTNLNKSVKSTDVYFLNEITGRINDFMNASLRLDVVFDDDYSTELQVAQVLSVGISFILI